MTELARSGHSQPRTIDKGYCLPSEVANHDNLNIISEEPTKIKATSKDLPRIFRI